ncbi:MAG: type I DNA topoisomerase, partial [Phycisphaeraceae bacterium]|nr:type I DNA topoisomerase [Phycisphaeraceae bacterium]
MAKKKSSSKKSRRGSPGGSAKGAEGKHLVIVESPTKAKTINKYLGSDYHVMSSVGHVRDLPKRAPKGESKKWPVPGVDLEHDFEPTYEVLKDKKKVVRELKKAAKKAEDVWFATDLDREGEAIAWHLAQELDIEPQQARRVVFNAITRSDIEAAFDDPRTIDDARVNAQQARRILDRIVGYRVSPLLWKKVAGGLSAGRVQSVATRLVVEREREIEAFVPDEFWKITGHFATDVDQAAELSQQWHKWLADTDEDESRPQKDRAGWLSDHACLVGELTKFRGKKFKVDDREQALDAAEALGLAIEEKETWEDEKAKGPAQKRIVVHTAPYEDPERPAPRYRIGEIKTKQTRSSPPPPFITSTMQQQASNRLGFHLQRTMRVAQQLYQGIDLKSEGGQTGLITYKRTDSTHISGTAMSMVREHIGTEFGDKSLPEKPRFYKSSNKRAQEAHEAIRPTDVTLTPERARKYLSDEQAKLYDLIWTRFVACQMTRAVWDSTTVFIHPEDEPDLATFKATGRKLAFDGYYRVSGVPRSNDVILPETLGEEDPLGAIQVEPTQHFTAPPPRYTEASLQKKLEEEEIGRPSTYASIISTIQNRNYVEPVAPRDRRLRATDLGRVVTDMLVEAFPKIMDVAYTREMEGNLDEVEEEREDWVQLLRDFYGGFKENLDRAFEE